MSETPNPNFVNSDTLADGMRPIRRCVISLGSNLGERRAKLQGAVDALSDTPEVWLTEVSGVYETEPVDTPEDSKHFFNAIVLLDTTLPARTLLDRAHAIEDAFGRERDPMAPNAPRTLDVDLIVVGERQSDEEALKLPHPRAHERSFVLVPWHEVEPDAEIPGIGPIAELVEKLGSDGVVRREDITLDIA